MMKYTHKELTDNVNISKNSSLKEFFVLMSGSLLAIILIYVLLGFLVDIIAPRISPELEMKLGKIYAPMYKNADQSEAGTELQLLLDELLKETEWKDIRFMVHLLKKPMINAMALPGNNIVIFSGLIKELDSENALSFVLAHELGHYANRDHLKGLGRMLVFTVFSVTLLGADNPVTNFFSSSLYNTEMKFSQKQEIMADLWALDLLNRRYGHVAGALQFFNKIKVKEKRGKLAYYFATHPHPETRISTLEREAKGKGYLTKATRPLNKTIRND